MVIVWFKKSSGRKEIETPNLHGCDKLNFANYVRIREKSREVALDCHMDSVVLTII